MGYSAEPSIGARLVDRLADDIDDAPERGIADRHLDRAAGVADLLAAHEAFGGVHGDGAHGVLAQVLRHLEHEARAVVLGLERVEDRRQIIVELHVDDGARHLPDATNRISPSLRSLHRHSSCVIYSASAPEMISISSFVIIA